MMLKIFKVIAVLVLIHLPADHAIAQDQADRLNGLSKRLRYAFSNKGVAPPELIVTTLQQHLSTPPSEEPTLDTIPTLIQSPALFTALRPIYFSPSLGLRALIDHYPCSPTSSASLTPKSPHFSPIDPPHAWRATSLLVIQTLPSLPHTSTASPTRKTRIFLRKSPQQEAVDPQLPSWLDSNLPKPHYSPALLPPIAMTGDRPLLLAGDPVLPVLPVLPVVSKAVPDPMRRPAQAKRQFGVKFPFTPRLEGSPLTSTVQATRMPTDRMLDQLQLLPTLAGLHPNQQLTFLDMLPNHLTALHSIDPLPSPSALNTYTLSLKRTLPPPSPPHLKVVIPQRFPNLRLPDLLGTPQPNLLIQMLPCAELSPPRPNPCNIDRSTLIGDQELLSNSCSQPVHSLAPILIERANQESLLSLFALQPKGSFIPILAQTVSTLIHKSRPILTSFPDPLDLNTLTLTDPFDPELSYLPKENGRGYLFSLTLPTPKNIPFGLVNKHFIFLLDPTTHLDHKQLATFKKGILRALPYLRDNRDSFTLLVAGRQLNLFESPDLPADRQVLSRVKTFLDTISYRGRLARNNLTRLMPEVAHYCVDGKQNVVILLTNQDLVTTPKRSIKEFHQLTKLPSTNLLLFTASTTQNTQNRMLDILSTIYQGETLHTTTLASFPRKLALLIRHINNLIIRDIRLTATDFKGTAPHFFALTSHSPPLYADRPYVIHGSLDKLKDFTLIIQGRILDDWITLRQKICAQEVDRSSRRVQLLLEQQLSDLLAVERFGSRTTTFSQSDL